MSLFVETIRICDGKAENLSYHEQRMNRTRLDHFGSTDPIALSPLLTPRLHGMSGTFKCRVEYDRQITKTEFLPYESPIIRNLMMVIHDEITYAYKSTDRTLLNQLKQRGEGCSDVLIIRGGLVTDTSFCNVAFFDGHHWITPANPLLKGTKRAQLVDLGMLIERDIPAGMIPEFQLIMLFNAMNEFGSILLPTHEIYGFAD